MHPHTHTHARAVVWPSGRAPLPVAAAQLQARILAQAWHTHTHIHTQCSVFDTLPHTQCTHEHTRTHTRTLMSRGTRMNTGDSSLCILTRNIVRARVSLTSSSNTPVAGQLVGGRAAFSARHQAGTRRSLIRARACAAQCRRRPREKDAPRESSRYFRLPLMILACATVRSMRSTSSGWSAWSCCSAAAAGDHAAAPACSHGRRTRAYTHGSQVHGVVWL
jgi:hypothetical protein